MEKYISAFNEIDLLMEGLLERLKIGLGEINAYQVKICLELL